MNDRLPRTTNPAHFSSRNTNNAALFIFYAITIAWGKGFELPAGSLDPGWREALVQATDQHLRFGSEVVFSFGPFHQLYTNALSQNLDALILGRWTYGIAWGAAAIGLANLSTPAFAWLIALFIAISGTLNTDASFYALQLTLLLIAANNKSQKTWPLLALIYSGIIASIFCKLSFAISAMPIILCAATLQAKNTFRSRKIRLAAIIVMAAIPIFLWLASGQSLTDIYHYLLGPNLSIVMGYSSAMATTDPSAEWQISAYWIGSILLSYIIHKISYSETQSSGFSILIALTSFFLFWVAFKAGMVRHDDGHGSISGQAMSWFAIITLAYANNQCPNKSISFPPVIAFFTGLSITSQYFSPIRSSRLDKWFSRQVENTYLFIKITPSARARQKLQSLRQNGFREIKPALEDLSLIPKGSTTDAFPWDITDIPANGLRYSPRPIIQSYSAYTPNLQDLNKNHFMSENAPSFLVLNASSIDGRNPPDLDYPSLEPIASRYKIIGTGSKGSLILKENPVGNKLIKPRWTSSSLSLLGENTKGDGSNIKDWTRLPVNLKHGSRFSIKFSLTPWRRLKSIAFKASPLYITIKFDDGSTQTCRVLETTARKIGLHPFVKDNSSLKAYILALQGKPYGKVKSSAVPVAMRLEGRIEDQGVNAARLDIQEPLFAW